MKSSKKKLMTPLERATAACYKNLIEEEIKAERELENAIAGAAQWIDTDRDA